MHCTDQANNSHFPPNIPTNFPTNLPSFMAEIPPKFSAEKTYVKNRGSHESSYRAANNSNFPPNGQTNGRTDERTNGRICPPKFCQNFRQNVNTHWVPRVGAEVDVHKRIRPKYCQENLSLPCVRNFEPGGKSNSAEKFGDFAEFQPRIPANPG